MANDTPKLPQIFMQREVESSITMSFLEEWSITAERLLRNAFSIFGLFVIFQLGKNYRPPNQLFTTVRHLGAGGRRGQGRKEGPQGIYSFQRLK